MSRSGGASGEAGTGRRDWSGRGRVARQASRGAWGHRDARVARGHRESVRGQGAGRKKEKKDERRREKEKNKKGKKGKRRKRKGGAGGIRGAGREPGVASTRSDTHEK